MIKIIGGGSINTAERRKLRRLGRIAARKMRAIGVYAPIKVAVESWCDEGGFTNTIIYQWEVRGITQIDPEYMTGGSTGQS